MEGPEMNSNQVSSAGKDEQAQLQNARQDEQFMLNHLGRVYEPQQIVRLRQVRDKIKVLEARLTQGS